MLAQLDTLLKSVGLFSNPPDDMPNEVLKGKPGDCKSLAKLSSGDSKEGSLFLVKIFEISPKGTPASSSSSSNAAGRFTAVAVEVEGTGVARLVARISKFKVELKGPEKDSTASTGAAETAGWTAESLGTAEEVEEAGGDTAGATPFPMEGRFRPRRERREEPVVRGATVLVVVVAAETTVELLGVETMF